LLVPAGFEFECGGGLAKLKVRGSVIGQITAPALGVAAELMRVVFNQTAGKQELTSFLLGNALLANQFEETSPNGGAFEQSAQQGEADLKALPGEGKFELAEIGPLAFALRVGVPPMEAKECGFVNKGDSSELEVKVVKTGAAAALKYVQGEIKDKPEPFAINGAPANAPECKANTKIGGVGTSCYARVEYTGNNMPGKGKYKTFFRAEYQEEGGNNEASTSLVLLEAEK
jgi:hypothetical protein